jgi:cytochrome c oxidase subunit 3
MSAVPRLAFQFSSVTQRDDAATLGMWIFLATELMFFGPLFFAYCYGRLYFPDAFGAASRDTDIVLGTTNTAVLLSSSFLMAMAVEACTLGARRLARILLWTTALLGLAFLFIKGTEYFHDWQAHLIPGAGFSAVAGHGDGGQLFFLLYFAMTGLHALHLTIGIVIVVILAIGVKHRETTIGRAEHLRIAALYWHFVDALWIFLFPLLYLVARSG